MDAQKQFKVTANLVELFPNHFRCKQLGKFDTTIPYSQVAGIRKNWLGMVEIETTGGKTYKLSMGNRAKDCVAALEAVVYEQ